MNISDRRPSAHGLERGCGHKLRCSCPNHERVSLAHLETASSSKVQAEFTKLSWKPRCRHWLATKGTGLWIFVNANERARRSCGYRDWEYKQRTSWNYPSCMSRWGFRRNRLVVGIIGRPVVMLCLGSFWCLFFFVCLLSVFPRGRGRSCLSLRASISWPQHTSIRSFSFCQW